MTTPVQGTGQLVRFAEPYPASEHDHVYFGMQSCADIREGFYCTREDGHDGRHEAAVTDRDPDRTAVAAAWPNTSPIQGEAVETEWQAGANAMLAAAEKALSKDADPSVWWFVGEATNRVRAARDRLIEPAKTVKPSLEAENAELREKLAALREHTLDSSPALRTLHDNAKAYLDAVAALQEVRGAPLSTTLAWMIRQGYLVPVAGSPVHEDERLTKLRGRAQLEIDDAKCGEGYFAEVNDGVGLASEQARRSAWETVLRLAGESS